MNNEAIVTQIQQGQDIKENMLLLYNNNLPVIKKICALFKGQESMEDLLQTSFLALYEAVKEYDPDKGYKFISFASVTVKRYLVHYIDECCQVVRLPEWRKAQIIKYRKFCNDFEMCNGRIPTDDELCQYFDIKHKELVLLKKYALDPTSLDVEYSSDDDSYALGDIVACDTNIEEECCDKIFSAQLQEIIEETLPAEHAAIVKARYFEGKTYAQTSETVNLPAVRCRSMEHEALRKLSYGKARKRLQEKLRNEQDAREYKTGLRNFRIHQSSQVERLALDNIEIKDKYKRYR